MRWLTPVLALTLAACSGSSPPAAPAAPATAPAPAKAATASPAPSKDVAKTFTPPPADSIPDTPFGKMVREGRAIFTDTQTHAKAYVGNGLNCSNCHLDAGRLPNAAPLWAAWGMYPAYRSKNGHVNTFAERLQGCFRYSMNGKAPPPDSEVIVALESYSYWLAQGAPTGVALAGRGYPKQGFKPPQPPDFARGQKVFETSCALCHGKDGQGQKVAGRYVFPPLWGPDSFNWGAGMHQLNNAAAFIKANMPLGRGGMLSDQDAWDVAMFMDAHERPQDPRFNGNVAETRKKYHDSKMSLYGTVVNGHLLGSGPDR
ncbi:cytochrome C [Oleiagrimonas soli]|uniref:Cytochrome C n=1 Tax=Oleiagrimonas soli TaxID=1543381 RepID=A0A099CXF5_9GAMM|nr:cytochrome C [Oleiagrimonas soli]